MKMIIITPEGEEKVFSHDDFAMFHHWLFAVLSGVPKCVTVDFDKDYNEIYRVNYD